MKESTPTFVAFVDCQLKNGNDWKPPLAEDPSKGWLKAKTNDAEIHLVAIDGTHRQIFFSKGTTIRITGNVLWFNASESDYLITDHDKKFSMN